MDVADIQTGQTQVKDIVADRCQKLFQEFLEEFRDDDSGKPKYQDDSRNLIKTERNTLTVHFPDVELHKQELATTIVEEFYRVYPHLCRALRNYVLDLVDDTIARKKEYYLAFVGIPTRLKVRELSTAKVGTLVRISGQVVRTHPVHPELTSGTFQCLDCQAVIKDVWQQFKYTQPTVCSNPECQNRSRFKLDTSKSKFVDFQKIRIQETQAELPRGAIPRSLEVIVRAEGVELAQAGDRCDFTGTLIVVPDVGALNLVGARAEKGGRSRIEGSEDSEGVQGLKALGVRELHYRMAFLACSIAPTNKRFAGCDWSVEEVTPENLAKQMTKDEWTKLFEMTNDKKLVANLTSSLFPTIHGNEEVKKGILLMLFGGVPKVTMEKTTLRGDINVCIVGDPSTAKSQFLKQVSDFSPRAVYTSGKASSAAGLTAAVVRDEETFEFVIEAGALMLADNGVCCIDEFDKMDPRDQVAIHEAMEQQTISITKAGIKATLNARTSILAAANPMGGRYDRNKSLRQNINMGAPIMSRFDLFFILIDDTNEVTDYAIARKIVELHEHLEESIDRVYTREEILRYIMFARQFKPKIGKEAAHLLITYYKALRERDTGGSSRTCWRITVRQLESMIRLAEAMARLHCCDKVEKSHVEEAYRLLNKSIIRVEQPDISFDEDEALPDNLEEEAAEAEIRNAMEVEEMIEEDGVPFPAERRRDIDETSASRPPASVRSVDADETSSQATSSQRPSGKKQLKLTYDEYKAMSTLIIMHMRRQEELMEIEGNDEYGLRKSEIIDWYLQEVQDELETVEALAERKLLTEKVIDRLILHDNAIIPLASTEHGQYEVDNDPVLVVHPNYVINV